MQSNLKYIAILLIHFESGDATPKVYSCVKLFIIEKIGHNSNVYQ